MLFTNLRGVQRALRSALAGTKSSTKWEKVLGKGWADVLRSRWVGVSLQPCCRTGNFAQELQKQICKEMISAREEHRKKDLVEEAKQPD